MTAKDVILAVAHSKSQARGDDGIPHSMVAKELPVIAPHLAKLFSVSLASIIKEHILSSPSEFRSIALLGFLSKVLEKLAQD